MRIVLPSVTYADFLAVTLPAWWGMVPRESLTVVTSPEDLESQALARRQGVGLHVTDAWTRNGATFNKALALDEAFGIVPGFREPPREGDVCLSLDADVFPCGILPASSAIAVNTLYGCARYECLSTADLRAHLLGHRPRRQLPLIAPRMRKKPGVLISPNTQENIREHAHRCLGYFQLFRWRPGVGFGSYNTAGKYDVDFRGHFATRVALVDFYVLHLGEQDRRNWRGRIVPRWKEA